jgi:dipicolinate synthase subunit A
VQTTNLAGRNVVIAGGDARDVFLAKELVELGANVWLNGFQEFSQHVTTSIKIGLPDKTDVIILPLPGLDTEGFLYAPYAPGKLHISDISPCFSPGILMLCGRMPASWQAELREKQIRVVLTADMDELAILNAVPTAEGALEVAMRESDVTISGSNVLVTGFGRCGIPLARLLAAMNATVTVAARKRSVLAMAEALGFRPITFEQIETGIAGFDFIFNTVPAMVLSEAILTSVKKSAVIVDIASSPGGTDFYAAERLGLKSFLALGLPGKVAPLTAGRILAKVYPHIICSSGKGGELT